jgi:hypothetical protein
MRQIVIVMLLITITSCSNKAKGWPQDERDKFTNSCVSKAMAAGNGLQEDKVKKYCNCYLEKMETKFPDIKDLEKIKIEELTKAAQECLPLMVDK